MTIDQDKSKLSRFLKSKKIRHYLRIVIDRSGEMFLRLEVGKKDRRTVKLFCRDQGIEVKF